MSSLGLCQNCLKVHEGSVERIAALHSEETVCDCGGQVCACEHCVVDASLILNYGLEAYRALSVSPKVTA